MAIDWRGVYAASTTECHPDESLDLVATKRHFERLIRGSIKTRPAAPAVAAR